MIAKGISHDDIPENGVEMVQQIISDEDYDCFRSSPTHSPRRVVSYFYRYFGSIVSKTTRIVLKKKCFLIHGLGKCEEVGEDSGRGLVI